MISIYILSDRIFLVFDQIKIYPLDNIFILIYNQMLYDQNMSIHKTFKTWDYFQLTFYVNTSHKFEYFLLLSFVNIQNFLCTARRWRGRCFQGYHVCCRICGRTKYCGAGANHSTEVGEFQMSYRRLQSVVLHETVRVISTKALILILAYCWRNATQSVKDSRLFTRIDNHYID